MKFFTLASTLSTLTLVSAIPNDVYRRQVNTNSSSISGSASIIAPSLSFNGTGPTILPSGGSGNAPGSRSLNSSAPSGGAGNAPVPASTTTQQFYTYTTIISSTATQVFQVPINGAGAVAPGSQNPGSSNPGSSPNNGGSGNAPVANGGAGNAAGVTTVFVTQATLTTTVGNGQCVCATPAVTATGVIPVTVQTQVVLGASTYTTSGVQTTIAPFVFQNGQAVPVTPVVTTTVTPVPNGAGAVAPVGQQFQTITIPASGSTPAYVVVVLVTVTNNYIPVVAPVPTGNGGNAGVPFANTTTSATSASSVSAILSSVSGTLTTIPVASATGQATAAQTSVPFTTATTAIVPTTTNTAQATAACATLTNVGSSPRVSDAAWIDALTCQHNQYRTRNQAAALTWSDALAQVALAAVNYNLQFNTGTDLTHTANFNPAGNPYGENLGVLTGDYNNYQHNVWDWYNEINQYSFANPGFSSATGHFTQVVWASSTLVGCAGGSSADGQRHVIACEYSPPGNYLGQFQNNVLATNENIAFPAEPPYIIPN